MLIAFVVFIVAISGFAAGLLMGSLGRVSKDADRRSAKMRRRAGLHLVDESDFRGLR